MFLQHIPNKDELSKDLTYCHICLEKTKLTREHIPPKKAFNQHNKLWESLTHDTNRMRTVLIKGGFWCKTICKKCNNEIGSKYANEYIKFVKQLVSKPTIYRSTGDGFLLSVDADTLFIAKEIAMMILAYESVDFAKHNYELRKFVLDKNYTIKSPYRILSFLVPDNPNSGTMVKFHSRVDSFAPGFGFAGGEISSYPFGFVYASEIGKGYVYEKMTDISHWFSESDYSVRTRRQLTFYRRLTGVESMHVLLSGRRIKPQIGYS